MAGSKPSHAQIIDALEWCEMIMAISGEELPACIREAIRIVRRDQMRDWQPLTPPRRVIVEEATDV